MSLRDKTFHDIGRQMSSAVGMSAYENRLGTTNEGTFKNIDMDMDEPSEHLSASEMQQDHHTNTNNTMRG